MPKSETSRANAAKARAARAVQVRARRIAKLKELTKEVKEEAGAKAKSSILAHEDSAEESESSEDEIIISKRKRGRAKIPKKMPRKVKTPTDDEDDEGEEAGAKIKDSALTQEYKELLRQFNEIKLQMSQSQSREPVSVNIYNEKPKQPEKQKVEVPIIKF